MAGFVDACRLVATLIQTGSGGYAAYRLYHVKERRDGETTQMILHGTEAVAGVILTGVHVHSSMLASQAARTKDDLTKAHTASQEALLAYSKTKDGQNTLKYGFDYLEMSKRGNVVVFFGDPSLTPSDPRSLVNVTSARMRELLTTARDLTPKMEDVLWCEDSLRRSLKNLSATRKAIPDCAKLYSRMTARADDTRPSIEAASSSHSAEPIEPDSASATADQLPLIPARFSEKRDWNRCYRLLPATYTDADTGKRALSRENKIFSQYTWIPPGTKSERPMRIPAYLPTTVDEESLLIPMEYSYLVLLLREQEGRQLSESTMEGLRKCVPAALLAAVSSEMAKHNIS